MNAQRLLQHFERIAEAPDAVPRLRRFILDLAVRGKLVEQVRKDEPASELLKQIRAQRLQSSKGKLRGQPELCEIADVEQPFPIPTGWIWLRFGELHALYRGVTYTKADVSETLAPGYLPILRANNIGATLNFEDLVFVRKERVGPEQILRHGDYLIALSSGSKNLVGKAAFVPADYEGGFGGFCGVIRLFTPMVEPFVGLFLSSRLYRDALAQGSRGIGINNLKKETITNVLFPLPPLAEQHRIVAKVDELMALCDRLEAAQAERENRRDRLMAASLHRLNNGAATESFREHARFHLHHLPHLTTRPEHIQLLRQTILNLAVRGKLNLQDPNDEPAPAFGIGLKSGQEDRLDLQLPRGWSWARVEDVAEARLGKMLDKAKNSGQPYRYLRNTNVHWFNVRTDDLKCLRIEEAEIEKYLLRNGDILICEGGHGIGRTAVWRAKEADIAFQKALHRVRPGPALSSDFFAHCVFVYSHSGVLQTYFTGVGIPHFTGKALSTLVFPLPPLAEQYRIVARVDMLMALCDRLEAQLITTAFTRHQLLEATIHQAISGQVELQHGGCR